jgi:hypothetical protein
MNLRWLARVVEIAEEANADQDRYIEMCKARLRNVPDDWELLTANDRWQSFRDRSSQVRYFRCSDGAEIRAPD